jgi:hypothetical protein
MRIAPPMLTPLPGLLALVAAAGALRVHLVDHDQRSHRRRSGPVADRLMTAVDA